MDNETPYSNRELREFFGDVKNDLAEIKAQTIKTNGRVSSLENWRYAVVGGLTVITVLIVPLFIDLLKR